MYYRKRNLHLVYFKIVKYDLLTFILLICLMRERENDHKLIFKNNFQTNLFYDLIIIYFINLFRLSKYWSFNFY